MRARTSRVLGFGAIVAMLATVLSPPLPAAPRAFQRGEVVPPGVVAASVVTLCGLAVMVVVQPHGAKATIYAGEAMESKLRDLGLDIEGGPSFDLADVYEPIAPACERIVDEHERALRTQLRD